MILIFSEQYAGLASDLAVTDTVTSAVFFIGGAFLRQKCLCRFCLRPHRCQSLQLVHKLVISLDLKASRAAGG